MARHSTTPTLRRWSTHAANYNPVSNTFQFDLKLPKSLTPGSHAVGVQVSAAGTVVNNETVAIIVKK